MTVRRDAEGRLMLKAGVATVWSDLEPERPGHRQEQAIDLLDRNPRLPREAMQTDRGVRDR
jgi:hypothetical protein